MWKRRFVWLNERKEAMKESRQRERRRERERETRRIWESSSYPLQTQPGTKAKWRNERKARELLTHTALLTGVHRSVRRSTSFPSSGTPLGPLSPHDSQQRDIRCYVANSYGSCRPGWLNARIQPEGNSTRRTRSRANAIAINAVI